MRLFVAVALPAAARGELHRVAEGLRAAVPHAKWVPPDNIHLTLVFLGEVAEERVGVIASAIARVAARTGRIPTALGGLGAFPSARRARVLWAGLRDDTGELGRLAEDTADALEPLGFTPESRPWTAHLTLARFRTPEDARHLTGAAVEPVAFTVDAITLYRSRLARPAPRYEPVAQVAFGG